MARTIDPTVEISPQAANADLEVWEHHLETEVENNPRIPDTERQALIVARRGQGLFEERVMLIEKRCQSNPSTCEPLQTSA